jgi:hypothetical protein
VDEHEDQKHGRAAHLALRGAELLDQAADRLVSGGWIETGLVVLLLGRALIVGHKVVRKAHKAGQKARVVGIVRSENDGASPAEISQPASEERA